MAGLTSYRPDRASSSMYPRASASSWLDREKSSRLQLTAKSVAEMMGISRQQLSNIEQSDNLPVMVKYIAFLRSRGVDLNDLFDRITKF